MTLTSTASTPPSKNMRFNRSLKWSYKQTIFHKSMFSIFLFIVLILMYIDWYWRCTYSRADVSSGLPSGHFFNVVSKCFTMWWSLCLFPFIDGCTSSSRGSLCQISSVFRKANHHRNASRCFIIWLSYFSPVAHMLEAWYFSDCSLLPGISSYIKTLLN